mmetsp:Transcript_36385/g.109215  ORF Transcript_36385/g.109215 Transcript_36385/m.109215 type:complete len:223 (+) Transcript_36385:873-1541(+)
MEQVSRRARTARDAHAQGCRRVDPLTLTLAVTIAIALAIGSFAAVDPKDPSPLLPLPKPYDFLRQQSRSGDRRAARSSLRNPHGIAPCGRSQPGGRMGRSPVLTPKEGGVIGGGEFDELHAEGEGAEEVAGGLTAEVTGELLGVVHEPALLPLTLTGVGGRLCFDGAVRSVALRFILRTVPLLLEHRRRLLGTHPPRNVPHETLDGTSPIHLVVPRAVFHLV